MADYRRVYRPGGTFLFTLVTELAAGGTEQRRTGSRVHDRRRGVWQRRFWEHTIRDELDYSLHLAYIHNAVKHGHALCPHAWPYSTFEKWVKLDVYEPTWLCACGGRTVNVPTFAELDRIGLEMGE